MHRYVQTDQSEVGVEATPTEDTVAVVQRKTDSAGASWSLLSRRLRVSSDGYGPQPGIPQGLRLTPLSWSSIKVEWQAPADGSASGYQLSVQPTASAVSCGSGTNVGAATSYTVTGLSEGRTYYFGLCAIGSSGRSSQMVTGSATTIVEPPRNPASISLARNQNSVLVSWVSAGENTAGFYVAMAQGATAPATCSGGIDVGLATQRRFNGLSGGTQYSFRVCAYNSVRTLSSGLTASVTTYSGGAGSGVLGSYYASSDLTGAVAVSRIDSVINYDWSSVDPAPGLSRSQFSVRWQGKIQPYFTGAHTFTIVSNDGMRLWVGGTLVVDDWSRHTARERSGSIALTAGQQVDIKVEYWQSGGDAVAILMWEAAGLLREVVPGSQLFTDGVPSAPGNLTATSTGGGTSVALAWTDNSTIETGFLVERSVEGGAFATLATTAANVTAYTDNSVALATNYTYRLTALGPNGNSGSVSVSIRTPDTIVLGDGLRGNYYNGSSLGGAVILSRVDSLINFNWGSTAPAPGVNQSSFSIRWTGNIVAEVSGVHQISTVSNDGTRIWIGGTQVISKWSSRPADAAGSISLQAGRSYPITIEYYQNGGSASMQFYWQKPGQASREIVPTRVLFSH